MAPPRRSARVANPSGLNTKKKSAVSTGLSFPGTQQLLQQRDEEEVEVQDQTYIDGSDADEDGEYDEATINARRRQAIKKSNKQGLRASRGKAPPTKPIDSDYDSDDKRIIHLKKLGYKDEIVSNKLVEEGRPLYSAKRIGTRWLRLKKIVEQKEDERLDEELSDWHIGEDEKLRECFNAAEERFQIELLKLKERKWREIAAALAESLREKKYTARACKERWEGLEDGSALLPIELDHDKEARTALREARKIQNQRRRDEKKAAALWAAGEKDRKAAEKRAILEQKDRERQIERARKQAERDEDERIKAEYRAGIEQRRAKQRAVEAEIKHYHENKRNERKNADAMYMYYTGKKLNGRRDHSLIKGADDDTNYDSDFAVGMKDFMYDDDEEPDLPDLTDAEESEAAQSGDDVETTAGKSARGSKSTNRKHGTKSQKTKVTLETLINPRTIMNDEELAEVLVRRNLRRRGHDESHAELVARIAAADNAESVQGIRDRLAAYFERRKGPREVLIRRLQEYDAASSILGMQGITAIDPEFKRGYEGYRGKFASALEE